MAKKARAKGPPRMARQDFAKHVKAPSPQPTLMESEPAELMAPADLMDYRRLRLGGPDDSQRSHLRPASEAELYFETLVSIDIDIDINVNIINAIHKSRSRADIVKDKSPPPGFVYASPWDGFDHSWNAESCVDIPSDSAFHNIPLLSCDTTSDLSYVIVPSEGPEAWRYVTLNSPLQAPLPEGPADMYVGDDFVLTSRLHTVAPGGVIELGVGVEEAIKTARNATYTEQSKGLLGSILELEHSITIEVANRLSAPAQLEVRERVPIARDGDDNVSVEIVAVDPPWQEFEQPRRTIEGSYRWRFTIPEDEEQTLKITYVIAISSKNEVIGGNRRER
jgi:hypothetical protein